MVSLDFSSMCLKDDTDIGVDFGKNILQLKSIEELMPKKLENKISLIIILIMH